MDAEEKQITIEEIQEMSDRFFPFRKDDGSPSYTEHQRETIVEICRLMLIEGHKFVAVDGPVGCGKSVINYTVARIIGSTVYLTPLNMLQDQIMDEHWKGVKMLKGVGTYACNHISVEENLYKCNYAGDRFDTCNNAQSENSFDKYTLDKVGKSIREVHGIHKNDTYSLKLHSSFNNPEEFVKQKDKMIDFIMKRKERFMERMGFDGGAKYNNDLEKSIVCSMSNKECPVKSARLLAMMASVKVLNPDIFYLLNSGDNETYGDNDLMVYDECHQIENVIQRIFKVKLPIRTIRDFFNIDLNHLYECDEMADLLPKTVETVKKVIGPIFAFSQLLIKLGDLINVYNFSTLNRCRATNSFATSLTDAAKKILFVKDDVKISVLDLAIMSTKGESFGKENELNTLNSFIDNMGEYYRRKCEIIDCDESIEILDEFIDSFMFKMGKKDLLKKRQARTRVRTKKEISDGVSAADVLVPEGRVIADHIIEFGKCIDPFIRSVSALQSVKNNDLPCFSVNKFVEERKTACNGTRYLKLFDEGSPYAKESEKCLEVTPIVVGALMRVFFYSRAKYVLLTSGTWVNPKKLFNTYGLPKDCKFIKIPTTFNSNHRRVYVIDDRSYTNFSAKREDGRYEYKTLNGIKKFTSELSATVRRVRDFIANQSGENPNVVIHPHTFDIAKKIAEFSPDVDKSYLVHFTGNSIINRHTDHESLPMPKDEMINIIKTNPNSGLTVISPSISEGVDFKGQIARAQIILKRPIPYLGDIYVRSYYKGNEQVGVQKDPEYLDRVCYTTLIQQYGRVMRGKDDWGITIVMDQSITMSLKKLLQDKERIKEMNIQYFTDGIRYGVVGGKIKFNWFLR